MIWAVSTKLPIIGGHEVAERMSLMRALHRVLHPFAKFDEIV